MAELEVVFYGMACFDEQRDGYRVLFPNGMDHSDAHMAGVWVRDRNELARVRWPWAAIGNDYFVMGASRLEISGVRKTKLLDEEFRGRLASCKASDREFTIAEDPDAIIDMHIDRGELSVHRYGRMGMRIVRWGIVPDGRTPVTFHFGDYNIELTPGTTQVILANVGETSDPLVGDRHFKLYRRLATVREGDLEYHEPQPDPLPAIPLKEPTFGYFTTWTPTGGCSPSVAK